MHINPLRKCANDQNHNQMMTWVRLPGLKCIGAFVVIVSL